MMPVIVKLLKDESIAVRFSAAMAIADTGYVRGAISVRRLLNDPDMNVRLAASYALTKLKKGELSEQIYAALYRKDQTIRANAVLLLGKLGDRKAINALNSIARDDHSSDVVRMQATESIAMLGGDDRTYLDLWAFLISKYIEDRAMGIRGMGALGTPESQNAILTMLTDESVDIRLLAAEQLGRAGIRAGEEDVIEYLTRGTGSPDSISRKQTDLIAVMAIGHIGGSKLADFLPKFLGSDSKDMRLQAAQSVLLLNRR
jgi:HEAT repeat protein